MSSEVFEMMLPFVRCEEHGIFFAASDGSFETAYRAANEHNRLFHPDEPLMYP